jgi:hypothetical protein
MTETIRRLRLSDLSECKARAKHERTRNDEHVDTFTEIGDCSGSDDVQSADALSSGLFSKLFSASGNPRQFPRRDSRYGSPLQEIKTLWTRRWKVLTSSCDV